MNQENTHEIETPYGKVKVVLKDFITGFDDEAIEAIYTSGKHEIETPDPNNPQKKTAFTIEGSVIQEAERESVKRVVVSVNGNTENVLESVYSLRKEDTAFIKDAVNKVINPPESDPKN